jgi:hypothetical protein
MRCSTVSPFVASAAACFIGAGVWARAAVSGVASIVAPISAAIARERTNGTGFAIGWVKYGMLVFLLDFYNEWRYRRRTLICDSMTMNECGLLK